MPPATAPARKFCLPATKALSETASVEATRPCTSMRAEGPKTTPFGFTSQTRPLDCSTPRIDEASGPRTRLRTPLWADCWMNRVASLAPMEKPRQLMIVPGVLVTVRAPACCEKTALPTTTCGPAGNAHAADAARAADTATPTARRRWHSLEFERAPFFIVSHPETAKIYYMLG